MSAASPLPPTGEVVVVDQSRAIVASEAEAALDHRMLIAAAAVRQAGTRTARLAARIDGAAREPDATHALVVTFRGTDPAGGARALAGSFHPRVAARAAASTSMKARFTFAF